MSTKDRPHLHTFPERNSRNSKQHTEIEQNLLLDSRRDDDNLLTGIWLVNSEFISSLNENKTKNLQFSSMRVKLVTSLIAYADLDDFVRVATEWDRNIMWFGDEFLMYTLKYFFDRKGPRKTTSLAL